jgi:hypothetical protein
LNPEALFSFLVLKIQDFIHFIHGTSEICRKNVDFQNFMEIPVVILFATVFVVTDLTFIVTLCKFKTAFEEIRLPSSFTSCLGLFTHDGPHFVVLTFAKTAMCYGQIVSPVTLHLLTIILHWPCDLLVKNIFTNHFVFNESTLTVLES